MASSRNGIVALLLALGLAGCLQTLPPPSVPVQDGATLSLGAQTVQGTEGLRWTGRELLAPASETACGPDNCDRFSFTFDVPDGFWDSNPGALEVSVSWPMVDAWNWREAPNIDLRVHGPTGEYAADRGGLAKTILLERAPPGVYRVEVLAGGVIADWSDWQPVVDRTRYDAVVQVELAPKGPAVDELPNLVVLAPRFLRIGLPPGAGELEQAATAGLGAHGCYRLEVIEQGARRCLRFQATMGNAGLGAFDLRLDMAQGASSYAGAGQYVQRIHRSDGSTYDVPAGRAAYHLTHEHVHYQEMMEFRLYRHDPARDGRGEPVAEGRKAGWCSGDIGLLRLGMTRTVPAYSIPWDCTLHTNPDEEWSMGIQPGWFDPYSASNEEQYVDMEGLGDGTYELVLRVNPSGRIRETDVSDNEASAIFKLVGDDVTVLSTTGWS